MANYQPKFIGREAAINQFHQLSTQLARQNALYITAEGGVGKTWLLREYFEHHTGTVWRRWHVHPTATPLAWESALIDFYRIENRSIPGLRRSIVERIGSEFFEEFLKADARSDEIAAETWFFAELQTARRKIKNYIVLFFDTFEVVYNLPAGRWFLETFLPHKAVQGYLIVFAGRPREFALPANVAPYKLLNFNEQETIQYFEQKFGVKKSEFGESEQQIIANSQGKPLLFDLWTHYARPVDDSEASLEPPERRLVKRFFEDPSPEGELLRSLAYLTRRFNREIFAAAGLRGDYERLEAALKNYPFVKYRPGEHSLTLHDEFQRMLAEYGKHLSERWNKQLYSKVVQGWYTAQINETQKSPQQQFLLEAEYLSYRLEYHAADGLAYFEQKFEAEIKPQQQFERRSLLWGTVAAFFDANPGAVTLDQQFRLYQMQGDWLYDKGRYAESAYELHAALHERFATVRPFEEWSRLAVRLGHCYLQTQRMEAAEQFWQAGLVQAQQRGARKQEQTFIYNLAHILNRRERLTKARDWYEHAIQLARELQLKHEYIEALYTCAPLQATMGEKDAAQDKINKVLARLNAPDPTQEISATERAIALIHLADTYRYLDRYDKAKELYKQAKDAPLSPPWHIRALTGEAATRLSIARAARQENSPVAADENLTEAIDLFVESVHIARTANIQPPPYRLFDRLAPLYRALHDFEFVENLPQPLTTLPEELPFVAQTAESALRFEYLPDKLARAQRLSELAYFLAIEQSHFHFALNSLLDAAIVAAYRQRWQDIPLYRRLAYALNALDVSARSKFFTDLFNLLQAYRHLQNHDWERGAADLIEYAARVANTPGSGPQFLRHQEPLIRHYVEQLPKQPYWQALIVRWQNCPEPLKGVATTLEEKQYWNS